MKIGNIIDWIIFLPFLLLLIPIIAISSLVGHYVFDVNGYIIAVTMIAWILKILFVVVGGGLAAAMIIGPWSVPGGRGLLVALLLGSWLTPLGLSCLASDWIPDGAKFVFGIEMSPLPTGPFIIIGMSIGIGIKVAEGILRLMIFIREK